ncbi:MAG TPA: tetratricopeptide repeat protein, partial [Anaerolineales bacterium]|nr:tetratricopeptide repeat protein [Anaerolineales bacterium]
MPSNDRTHAYLSLADDLFKGTVLENDLPAVTAGLPVLDKELLDILANQAETLATTQPRLGWAITKVAQESASLQSNDLFLHSLSAWYLARACNHWTQPKRVHDAVYIARRGFTELKDKGWLAACDWQDNALAWTKLNFTEAAQKLKEALNSLEGSGLDEFIPDCRLSLAYAQILIGEHEDALKNIRLSEAAFITRGDALNQARCWLYQASSLRRQDQFEEAHHKLESALSVFEHIGAIAEQAKARYQMALGHLLKTEDLPLAIRQFTKAVDMFKLVELDLWQAMCVNSLGAVYLFTGELTLADSYLQQAGEVFATQGVNGLLADNMNDHGEVNILRGKPRISIEQFKKSVELNKTLGANLSAAVVSTNLGKAYGQYGRYQDALFHLEQAAEQLQVQNSYLRLGTCEKYIALIWSHLGQPGMAHEHLDQAEDNYDLAGQKAMISEVKNIRAAAFFQQGEDENAIQCLQEALEVSMKFGVRPQTALARRLLGEALVQTGTYEEALRHLTQAYADFSDMDMQMDMAACLVAVGNCHAFTSKFMQAEKDYQQALNLSESVLPEIEWRAEIGLGDLAKDSGDITLALNHYRRAVNTFSQIRQNFWQPGLAGAYLKKPAQIFDGIILFASAVGSLEETFFFIERSKASTLTGQLFSDGLPYQNSTSHELADMQAEILFLQDQLRSSLDKLHPFQAGSDLQQVRARLGEKTQQFEKEKARLERQAKQGQANPEDANKPFDEFVFRTYADKSLQGNWAALDFYLSGNVLVTVFITPDKLEVFSTQLPHRFNMALDACKRAGQNAEAPTQGDLDVLGKTLIPAQLAEHLTPETFLILSPNKELHGVPWAALKPAGS